jgi:arginine N-succinyltransferase
MPRTPVYVALLTDAAKSVIGQPHPSGRAALRMLEQEGFYFERYIDIFDGGPTVTATTDEIRTIRESSRETLCEIGEGGKMKAIAAGGRLKDFRACCASVRRIPHKGVCIDPEAAELLEAKIGDQILVVPR